MTQPPAATSSEPSTTEDQLPPADGRLPGALRDAALTMPHCIGMACVELQSGRIIESFSRDDPDALGTLQTIAAALGALFYGSNLIDLDRFDEMLIRSNTRSYFMVCNQHWPDVGLLIVVEKHSNVGMLIANGRRRLHELQQRMQQPELIELQA